MFSPYTFPRSSLTSKNRVVLAPMTNTQSEPDGTLSSQEKAWLEARAAGGFGITMTCAARVADYGQGWPGQLAVSDDRFVAELSGLADSIAKHGSLGIVQIHHGGARSPAKLNSQGPYSVSNIEKSQAFPEGARELSQD